MIKQKLKLNQSLKKGKFDFLILKGINVKRIVGKINCLKKRENGKRNY